MPNDDWYPTSEEGERNLYGNIDEKIDGFEAKYPFLTTDYLGKVHTFCLAFMAAYDAKEQNKAAAKAFTGWFRNLARSEQKNEPVDAPPVFVTPLMPAATLAGIEKQCRAFAALMKSQDEYDEADGLALMIEKAAASEVNLAEAQPHLKLSVAPDGTVTIVWTKAGFEMLELQCRKAGASQWQHGDKTTEKSFTFEPQITTPGVPEKFEFRAIYILDGKRVGLWSPVYVLTIG